MKIIIAMIAFLFFGYWFNSVTSIGEPEPLYCESPFGDKIAILPIIGDSCQMQIKSPNGKFYAIPIRWSWQLSKTVLMDYSKNAIGVLEPDGAIYFYTDLKKLKQPLNELN